MQVCLFVCVCVIVSQLGIVHGNCHQANLSYTVHPPAVFTFCICPMSSQFNRRQREGSISQNISATVLLSESLSLCHNSLPYLSTSRYLILSVLFSVCVCVSSSGLIFWPFQSNAHDLWQAFCACVNTYCLCV